MNLKRTALLLILAVIACAIAATAGLLILGLGILLEVLDRLRGYGPSCESCVLREGRWCRCRPLVERLNPTTTPEAPGRIPVKDSWRICGGDFYRGRS